MRLKPRKAAGEEDMRPGSALEEVQAEPVAVQMRFIIKVEQK